MYLGFRVRDAVSSLTKWQVPPSLKGFSTPLNLDKLMGLTPIWSSVRCWATCLVTGLVILRA